MKCAIFLILFLLPAANAQYQPPGILIEDKRAQIQINSAFQGIANEIRRKDITAGGIVKGDLKLKNADLIFSTTTGNAGITFQDGTTLYTKPITSTSTIIADLTAIQAALSTAVYTTNSYANPAWITSLATGKIDLSTVTSALNAHSAALSTAAYTPVTNTFISTNTFRQTITAPNYRISNSVVLSTTNGSSSVAVGVLAGDNSTGQYNTYLGETAGRWQSSGVFNTLIGYFAGNGPAFAYPYSSNTIVGALAGSNSMYGSGNILIGYNVNAPAVTTSDYLNIGNLIKGDIATSSVSILGSLWANNVYADNLVSSTAAFITSTAAIVSLISDKVSKAGDTMTGMLSAPAYQIGANVFISTNGTNTGNVKMGFSAGSGSTGDYNTLVGYYAGGANTSGQYNTNIGNSAGLDNTTGHLNTSLGSNAGENIVGNYNTFLGASTGLTATSGDGNIIIGYNRDVPSAATSNFLNIGGIILSQMDASSITILGNIFSTKTITSSNITAMAVALSTAVYTTGNQNIGGIKTFTSSATAQGDIVAHRFVISPGWQTNTRIGAGTGEGIDTGQNNFLMGYNLFTTNPRGSDNVIIGNNSINAICVGGCADVSSNVIVGSYAGAGIQGGANANVIIGYKAAYSMGASNGNITIGYRAGYAITSGTGNIVVGYNQDTSGNTASNELNIGGVLKGNLADTGGGITVIGTATVQGSAFSVGGSTLIVSAGKVGIGAAPQSTLHVEASTPTTAIRIVADDNNFNPRIDFVDDRDVAYRNARIEVLRDMSAGGDAIIFSNAADNAAEAAGTLTERLRITRGGNVGVGEVNPTSQLYVSSWTSSLGYIDRTDYPDTLEEAYLAVKSSQKKINGKGLDHTKLTDFVRHEAKREVYNEVTKSTDTLTEYGRNLTATVSALNEVIKDLIKRIEALEKP